MKSELLKPRISSMWGLNVILTILVIPLLIYTSASVYVRYMADDYCVLGSVLNQGIWDYVVTNYQHWTGRFTSMWFYAIAARYIPPNFESIIIFIFLVVWWLIIFSVLFRLLHSRQVTNPPLFASLGATLLLLTVLTGSANVVQTIYWQQSLLMYVMPYMLWTVYLWVVFNRSLREVYALALCIVLPFIAGGCTEICAVIQVIFAFAGTITFRHEVKLSRRFAVGFIVSVVTLVIVVIAPGNAVRRELMYPVTNLNNLFQNIITSAAIPIVLSLRLSPFNCLLLSFGTVSIAFFLDKQPSHNGMLYLSIVPILFFTTCALTIALGFYATNNILPSRAITGLQYIGLGLMMLWGYLWGLVLRDRKFKVIKPIVYICGLLTLSIIVVIYSSIQAINTLQNLKSYAEAWDMREAQIQTAKLNHDNTPTVNYIDNKFDLEEIGPDVNNWPNSCAAQYYGFKSIVTKPIN